MAGPGWGGGAVMGELGVLASLPGCLWFEDSTEDISCVLSKAGHIRKAPEYAAEEGKQRVD